jgi:peptidoglycan hydrolase CwlO-like protein
MKSWIKQNFTIMALIAITGAIGTGIAFAAVLNSDVQRLKTQFDGEPEKLSRLEQKIDDINYSVHEIQSYLIKRGK